jgi:hypothetical protein
MAVIDLQLETADLESALTAVTNSTTETQTTSQLLEEF